MPLRTEHAGADLLAGVVVHLHPPAVAAAGLLVLWIVLGVATIGLEVPDPRRGGMTGVSEATMGRVRPEPCKDDYIIVKQPPAGCLTEPVSPK